tara:strand:- start:57 stop:686 length:630 start_codon:yes stop_codon:yes gene_type:complete
MYFSITPNILYDEKPIEYPFSSSDRVVAKNFFRRYKLNDDIFSYAVFFNKYAIKDGERPDILAQKIYGNQYYDWVILLTNNLVNAQYDWPLSNYDLVKVLEKEYDDPYNEIHHYETVKTAQYPAGLRVDKAFYDKLHKVNIDGTIGIIPGSQICGAITVADHFNKENEKRREIYLLKQGYLRSFVNDFKKQNQYKKSDNYIGKRLKITG